MSDEQKSGVDRRQFMSLSTWAIGALIGAGMFVPAAYYLIGPALAEDPTALAAVTGATGGRLTLELRGAKAIRAFDTWVIVVSISCATAKTIYLRGKHPPLDVY